MKLFIFGAAFMSIIPLILASGYGKMPGGSIPSFSYDLRNEKRVDIYNAIEDLQQQLLDLKQQRCILKEQERLIEIRLQLLQRRLDTYIPSLSSTRSVVRSPPPPMPDYPPPPVPDVPQSIYKNPVASSSEAILPNDQTGRRWFERKTTRKTSNGSISLNKI